MYQSPRHALMGRVRSARALVGYMPGYAGYPQAGLPLTPVPYSPSGAGGSCAPGCGPSTLNYPAMAVNQTNGALEPTCGKARVYPLNFGIAAVPATGNALARQTVTARPQKTFKAQRLIIPSFIAQFFVIHRIQIGTNNQSVDASGVGISAQVFSEVSQNSLVEFDTAVVGIDITLDVENISNAAQNFYATFLGPTLE